MAGSQVYTAKRAGRLDDELEPFGRIPRLNHGGGWFQSGYRYFLDSVPFVIALCGMAAASSGAISMRWKLVIAAGTLVMSTSVAFAHLN